MVKHIDVGPLLWVKDEINQSLKSVLESAESVNRNPQDTASMRFSRTYLYQVSGALDMVGLEGCKLYCDQLEKFATKLEKKELTASPNNLALFVDAIKALQVYIDHLLSTAVDIPSRLHPVLEPLVIAMGEIIEESELFFPDIHATVPNDVPSKELNEDEYTVAMLQQRAAYQKSLLNWMQTHSATAVAAMHQALSQVALVQHNKRVKTLWWAASAFIETLGSTMVADNTAAKKVCRKLDQALRQLVMGENRPNHQLFRDMLYFVAYSDVETDTLKKVRSVFSLDGMPEHPTAQMDNAALFSPEELKLVDGLKLELDALRDIWQRVSNSIPLGKMNTDSDAALVELDNVLITQFADKLGANQTTVAMLSQRGFAGCYQALLQASIALRDHPSKVTQGALVGIASALNLLDAALLSYRTIDSNMAQHLLSETEMLNAIEAGLDYRQQQTVHEAPVDKETIAAVVKDIGASLKVVEQSLDTFFRTPTDKATLSLAPKPLKHIAAIFDMLNLPLSMQVIKACSHYIQYFQQHDYVENPADFELLAESLAMLGLYKDELPTVRAETQAALEEKLTLLNQALSLIGVTVTEQAEEPLAIKDIVQQADRETEQAETAALEEANATEQLLDQAFDEELLDIYLTEAEEIIAQIAQGLQSLRVNATSIEPLVDVRRHYHTLKGSGRTVGLFGQAEVASSVEYFLNGVLEQASLLNAKQIAQLEKITATFAEWVAELRANSQALINQPYWLNQVQVLYQLQEPLDRKKQPSTEESSDAYVLIAGKHKIGRQLYDVFLNESMQHLIVIEQDVARLQENPKGMPEKRAKQAAHTLASNALASGFKPMGELCRALESWLETVNWTPGSLALYENVTKAIARMWQSISQLKMPRTAKALVNLLDEASEQVIQAKSEIANSDSLIKEVAAATEVPPIESPAIVEEEADTKHINAELLSMFVEEANTLLPEIGTALRAWKQTPAQTAHYEVLQRLLHTLKGSARMAGQAEIGDIAHELEEVILQKAQTRPTEDDFETMFIALDNIVGFFDKTSFAQSIGTHTNTVSTAHHVQATADIAHQAATFLRIREEVLGRLINDAGEVSIIRSRVDREMADFRAFSGDLTDSLARLRNYLRELEIEAETQMQSRMNILLEANEAFDPLELDRFTRLQELTRMMAESVSDVSEIQNGLLSNLDRTEAALQQQSRMNRDLQQGLLGVRMLPFQHISERMQRIVRQTARELHKSVDLIIEGETTKIDRGVLEKVSASLEHLLRNAVAHGIENKAERRSLGKAETGVITMLVRAANDEIQITLSDDGAGVNLEKVKLKALQKGLLEADTEATEETLLSVIFEPGFSTETEITQISGRGIGLDVVRSDISGLGGRLEMTSEVGKGAIFNIYVPVTQSVAQVLMVRASNNMYALPVAMIEQAQKIKHHDLMAIYRAGKIQWNDADYPIAHLAQLLNLPQDQAEEQAYASVLLLRSGLHTVALQVDEVMGNQEVVMKEIGTQLARVPGITGATVTGNGDIILVINPVLISNRSRLALGAVTVKNVNNKPKKTRVLVVDDSLTMRKVLARLLEREGYEVQIAKDGMDAMDLLKIGTPDIILTDIEMPRLDGFGLARNIRDDARLMNTPLIMISSRTADKHQTLAKEIGVDAFFGKPVQDEALVDTMKALLSSPKN